MTPLYCATPKNLRLGLSSNFFGSQYTYGEVGKKKGQKSVKKILGRLIHYWVKESHGIIRFFIFGAFDFYVLIALVGP